MAMLPGPQPTFRDVSAGVAVLSRRAWCARRTDAVPNDGDDAQRSGSVERVVPRADCQKNPGQDYRVANPSNRHRETALLTPLPCVALAKTLVARAT
jgi:hypothetical protein